MRNSPLAVALLIWVTGCASVPRGPALQLAQAGEKATAASEQSLLGLSNDVSQIAERQLVRTALIECGIANQHATAGSPIACVPVTLGVSGAIADPQNQKLAAVILLRVRAIKALGAAYAALQDEANYNARGELEGAIGNLDTRVNDLTSGLQALGTPSLSLLVIEPLIQKAAGEAAAAAQVRRLKAASAEIRMADEALAKAIGAEAALYSQIAAAVMANKAHMVDELIAQGLVDPTSTVISFESTLGVAPPAQLAATDPMAIVLTRTIVAYRAQRDGAAAADAYQANVRALQALIVQHRQFERGQLLSMDDVVNAISELSGWVTIVQGLKDTSAPAPESSARK